MGATSSDILLYIVAIFLPPVPVAVKRGCGGQLCLNFVLWILIWIPAVIHSFYIIASTPDVEKYEAVNMPSHYQNHPPAGAYGQHQQSFQGNGPPQNVGAQRPPPPAPMHGQGQGHRAEEWDTPMQAGQQQQGSAYAPHPQQQQLHGYGQKAGYEGAPAPPSYNKS